jgi:hypothetical protein
MEQLDWLDRRGVNNPGEYKLVRQTKTHVYLRHRQYGYVIERKKDMPNWVF